MANEEYPFNTFNFYVQLNIPNASALGMTSPVCDMEFAELDGLEMSMEPKTVKEGGNNTEQINLVGRVTYSNVTLKRGMTSNLDLWKWFMASTGNTNRSTRASGTILVKDANGADRVRFLLYGCLPVKIKAPALNAKEGAVAIEEMEIALTSFRVEAPA